MGHPDPPPLNVFSNMWSYCWRSNTLKQKNKTSWVKSLYSQTSRISRPEVFCEKVVLRNLTKFTGKHLRQSLFIEKETLAQVFSCEFYEISKKTFFTEHLWTTASISLIETTKLFSEDYGPSFFLRLNSVCKKELSMCFWHFVKVYFRIPVPSIKWIYSTNGN